MIYNYKEEKEAIWLSSKTKAPIPKENLKKRDNKKAPGKPSITQR